MKKAWMAVAAAVVIVVVLLVALYRPSLNNAAGYMVLRNYGLASACIVGVEVTEPQGVMAMLHETVTVVDFGVQETKMMPVDRICVGPLGTFELKPGRHHVMLMNDLSGSSEVRMRLRLGGEGASRSSRLW